MRMSARLCALLLLLLVPSASAQYRGFWVDTFNTPLNNHADVVALVESVTRARCNAIFVQARRRSGSRLQQTWLQSGDGQALRWTRQLADANAAAGRQRDHLQRPSGRRRFLD
ncbi:MAG: hypothetical protein SF339_16985 [Blastocatellia bacterium]|nr:hypothetical protein [Blastocatellia bacterium]